MCMHPFQDKKPFAESLADAAIVIVPVFLVFLVCQAHPWVLLGVIIIVWRAGEVAVLYWLLKKDRQRSE